MPGSAINNVQQVNGAHQLPLQLFFTELKRNGFLVTPEQIADANRIINHYSSRVKNEAEIGSYLSPLFVRNEEEQLQFEDIFKAHFIAGKESHDAVRPSSVKNHFRKLWWAYVSAMVLMTILFIYFYRPSSTVLNHHPDIYLYDKNEFAKKNDGKKAFQLTTNEKLEVYALTQYGAKDSTHHIALTTKYSWGDYPAVDTGSSHIYNSGSAC